MVKFEGVTVGQMGEHCAVDGWSSLSAEDYTPGITDLDRVDSSMVNLMVDTFNSIIRIFKEVNMLKQ